MKMDKSMIKILTKQKGLNVDPINLKRFEFLLYAHLLKKKLIQNFQIFIFFQIALTHSQLESLEVVSVSV